MSNSTDQETKISKLLSSKSRSVPSHQGIETFSVLPGRKLSVCCLTNETAGSAVSAAKLC